MDKFLHDLYEEEMTKKANADYQEFLETLSIAELEKLAGVKTAVEGPAKPSEPSGKAIEELDTKLKAPAKKTTPPEMPAKTAEANFQHADRAGRIFAKQAGLPKYLKDKLFVHGGVTHAKDWPKDKRLMHALEQRMAGKQNQPLFKGPHAESLKEIHKKAPPEGSMADKWKRSKESLRSERTKTSSAMIITAMNATKGAPDHIRKTAAALVGEKLAGCASLTKQGLLLKRQPE